MTFSGLPSSRDDTIKSYEDWQKEIDEGLRKYERAAVFAQEKPRYADTEMAGLLGVSCSAYYKGREAYGSGSQRVSIFLH